MLGSEPDPKTPKLGESLDLVSTVDVIKFFPELLQYCVPKKAIVYYRLNRATYLPVDVENYAHLDNYLKLCGYNVPPTLVHIDRLAFDAALFKSCTEKETCIFINDKVVDLDYKAETDCFKQLTLSNGQVLQSSFIFDATNHARLIPKKLAIPYRTLSQTLFLCKSSGYLPLRAKREGFYSLEQTVPFQANK